MKTIIAILGAVALGGLSPAAQARQDEKAWLAFRKEAFRKEDEGVWKKIRWEKDMGQALEKAKAESKPILVFLVVGQFGRKNAAEC